MPLSLLSPIPKESLRTASLPNTRGHRAVLLLSCSSFPSAGLGAHPPGQCALGLGIYRGLPQSDHVSNRGESAQEWGGVKPRAGEVPGDQGICQQPCSEWGSSPRVSPGPAGSRGCEVTSRASAGPAAAQAVLQCPPAARDMCAHTGMNL